MTGSVVLGIGMAACVLAVVVSAVLMQAVSPCDGGAGLFPVGLLVGAVVGSTALAVTTAVAGPGWVVDVVAAAVVAGVGVPAVVGGGAWVAGEVRFRSAWRGVR